MAVSQGVMTLLQISLSTLFRNMWTHLQAQLASGCLVMRSLAILLDLLSVKSKIISSGSSGSVEMVVNLIDILLPWFPCLLCSSHLPVTQAPLLGAL